MKITIELEGTGEQNRKDLMDFLGSYGKAGGDLKIKIGADVSEFKEKLDDIQNQMEAINTLENGEKISEGKNEVIKETRTRKTKAQIAAEEAKADDASGDNDQTNTLAQDNTQQNAPTFTMDQVKAKFVEIGRAGKRDHGLEVLKKFGADTVSKENPLAPEHYEAVIAELGKL